MLRLHEVEGEVSEGADARTERDPTARRSSRLRCARCGACVAEREALFAMHPDGPRVVFVNPHGRVFEIVTLRHAESVVPVTAPTTESSWFDGYAWRVVVCGVCATHLGWSFHANVAELAPATFFGLILAALSDAPDDAN